ncbi:pleckstrin homology domain-containing family G member 4B-like [Neosynchiropus ocellatus]
MAEVLENGDVWSSKNSDTLEGSIQDVLSVLYPPFDSTAPILLSQLFQVIDRNYQGDALKCLLDFLVPAKHILDSVQQAACAQYSNVLFVCEGWPLCLRDKVVVQLASIKPFSLQPGDFYLQVAPFCDQSARILVCSLLEEEGLCSDLVEETPIPEASYPCIFSLDWLVELNQGRHGTPLSQCLLSTEQGVVRMPWEQVAVPHFLDEPKCAQSSMASAHSSFSQLSPSLPRFSSPNCLFLSPSSSSETSHCSTSSSNPSAFSVQTRICPAKHGIAVSLYLVESSSKVSKETEAEPKSDSHMTGTVPHAWTRSDSATSAPENPEVTEVNSEAAGRREPAGQVPAEGDYIDVLQAALLFRGADTCVRAVRFLETPCTPCMKRRQGAKVTKAQELRCRYRDSYQAALQNPVNIGRNNDPKSDNADPPGSQSLLGPARVTEMQGNHPASTARPRPNHLPLGSPDPRTHPLYQGVATLTGGRDKTGRAIVEIYGDHPGWRSNITSQELQHTLLYFYTITRRETDVVTSLKALMKIVEESQRSSRLEGILSPSYCDWTELHQKLFPFVCELHEASSLLLKAIRKLEEPHCVDSVQSVKQCMLNQRTLMKDVLEDSRLVGLQREGGAILARLRKESDFKYPNSSEAERLEQAGLSYPETEAFRTLVSSFKSGLEGFLCRAEACGRELQIMVNVCDFCDQSYLNKFLQFSAERFQEVKAQASALRGSRGMQVWNSAWLRCQEAQQLLQERVQEEDYHRRSKSNNCCEHHYLDVSHTVGCQWFPWSRGLKARSASQDPGPTEAASTGPTTPPEEQVRSPSSCSHRGQPSSRVLQEAQKFQISRHGSFCSEDSCVSEPGAAGGNSSLLCKHSSLPAGCYEGVFGVTGPQEGASTALRLQRVLEELVFTEREYVSSLGYILTHYLPLLDRPDIPQDLRGKRGIIFGNLEKLHDFHTRYFLPELEACQREPVIVARCFLRHSESFGLYALYSKNKPRSDALILHRRHDIFKKKQQELGDLMDLSSYLLRPIQRISKYSLLLQDMLALVSSHRHKTSRSSVSGLVPDLMGGVTKQEIQDAVELVRFQMRHGNDLLTMDAIQDCDVNLKEQGQLIRQDEFTVLFRKKKCVRRIFLFEHLILFSKTKKTDVGNDVYVYKQSFKTCDIGMTHNSAVGSLCFEIWFRRRKSQDTYTLKAPSMEMKKAWTADLERILWEQAAHSRELRMQERVFMGMFRKPFMDIHPSEAAIRDRAITGVPPGRRV